MISNLEFRWTNGADKAFQKFYLITEDYYSSLVGGIENRRSFIPYNFSEDIQDVLVAYIDDVPVACTGFKKYSESDMEIKRVWVEPEYRGHHIAVDMIKRIEDKAKRQGFRRAILQTREIMKAAVELYEKLGYHRINNYPPYDKLDGAICFAKEL